MDIYRKREAHDLGCSEEQPKSCAFSLLRRCCMFARIVILKHRSNISVMVLPHLDHQHDAEIMSWIRYMQEGTKYAITQYVFPLFLADYIVTIHTKETVDTTRKRQLSFEQVKRVLSKQIYSVIDAPHKQKSWHTGTKKGQEAVPENWNRQQFLRLFEGRKLFYSEIQSLIKEAGTVEQQDCNIVAYSIVQGLLIAKSGVAVSTIKQARKSQYLCRRCYADEVSTVPFLCESCGEYCAYCKNCIMLGHSRTCSLLLIGQYNSGLLNNRNALHDERIVDLEQYHLSPAQQVVAKTGLKYMYEKFQSVTLDGLQAGSKRLSSLFYKTSNYERKFLIWAVTGAGKTEMIFPFIDYVTTLGGKVLLATPRRDVVIELEPRLKKAFPQIKVVTLYGGSSERWNEGGLFIATTHQLMRFHHAFELVIIDELDAFPYHGDKNLYQVAEHSNCPGGITVLLSATPPKPLQRAISWRQLAYVRLPVRYHRHPLPVPKLLSTPTVAEQLRRDQLPPSIKAIVSTSFERGAQLFVFVQRIAQAEPYVALIKRSFPHIPIMATSSKDKHRAETVQRFRRREVRVLVTTTILERGVTIPQSDVLICDADGALFDESSLVQMAGRAGRSSDDPCGRVYFAAKSKNSSQLGAVRQIKTMNTLAKKGKYLLPQYL